MPQMAPIWWTTMSLIFISSLSLIMMMMYFLHQPSSHSITTNVPPRKSINWKW